jgi:hypothetical protein
MAEDAAELGSRKGPHKIEEPVDREQRRPAFAIPAVEPERRGGFDCSPGFRVRVVITLCTDPAEMS